MSIRDKVCPNCGKVFPLWYWGTGNYGQFRTSRKPGIAKYNFERHVKSCGKPKKVPKYRMRIVITSLSEKRKTSGNRIKLVLECDHVVKPTYSTGGVIYGKTKVRCYECVKVEFEDKWEHDDNR
jgi:hypothetical protein